MGTNVKPTTRTPVLIIGGGPAGLSVGHELKKLNLDFIILERGGAPGESWRRMPRSLKLLSPWAQNVLPGTSTQLADLFRLRSAREFAEYLKMYSDKNELPVITNAHVTSLARTPDGQFVAETADAYFHSDTVVNATGYYLNPSAPRFTGADTSAIPQIHVAHYFDPANLRDQFGDVKKVLVIGKRISAGQTALELFEAGFSVAISHRSRIEFSRHPYLILLSFSFYYLVEDLVVRLWPQIMPDSFPPMEGGRMRTLIKTRQIGLRPQVRKFNDHSIAFEDGSVEEFDLVIYATGFKPALAHIQSLAEIDPTTGLPSLTNMESAHTPGLFFIGLDRQRSFRSRYLRGIREDARHVAAKIHAYLQNPSTRGRHSGAAAEVERSENIFASF